MLLPVQTPRWLLVAIGFISGMLVDWFTIHPGYLQVPVRFIGFARPIILSYDGAKRRDSESISIPSKFHLGRQLVCNLCQRNVTGLPFYFIFQWKYLRPYLVKILLKTIFSFILSILLMLLYVFIFDPE